MFKTNVSRTLTTTTFSKFMYPERSPREYVRSRCFQNVKHLNMFHDDVLRTLAIALVIVRPSGCATIINPCLACLPCLPCFLCLHNKPQASPASSAGSASPACPAAAGPACPASSASPASPASAATSITQANQASPAGPESIAQL
jgi:hypothetical protein